MRNWLAGLLVYGGLRLMRGGDTMSVIYALLIIKGLKTYAQVPAKLQPEVKTYLAASDLDENGDPLPAK
jgi:hypothetical protein